MFLAKFSRTCVVAAIVLAGLQLDAAADPVSYDGTLLPNSSASGELPPTSTVADATQADYWRFWATAGDLVTVYVERADGELDPAQFVYSGIYVDTTDPGLTNDGFLLGTGSNMIDFGDDERPGALPGPYGDPESVFIAPVTGWYTVAVTSFISDPVPPDGDYDYTISVKGNTGYSPNPEPGTMILLSGALAAAGAWRRRRSKRAAV